MTADSVIFIVCLCSIQHSILDIRAMETKKLSTRS